MRASRSLALSFAFAAWAMPAVARACSIDIGAPIVQPSEGKDPLPKGSFVVATSAPVSRDGTPWTEDVKLSALLERSRRELRPYAEDTSSEAPALRAFRRDGEGTALVTAGVEGSSTTYTWEIAIAGEPPRPPPSLDDVAATVTYVEGGSSGRGCACPEVDTLTISSSGVPSGAARPAYVAVWFGATEDVASGERDPDALMRSSDEPTKLADFALGVADGHERSGAGFGRAGRYCFAVAWTDTLGRTGERSKATCLDSTDTKDPAVTVDDEGTCLCLAVGASRRSSGGSVVVPLALVAIARRLLRRRNQGGPSASTSSARRPGRS